MLCYKILCHPSTYRVVTQGHVEKQHSWVSSRRLFKNVERCVQSSRRNQSRRLSFGDMWGQKTSFFRFAGAKRPTSGTNLEYPLNPICRSQPRVPTVGSTRSWRRRFGIEKKKKKKGLILYFLAKFNKKYIKKKKKN
jgi:hypothetical protein